MPDIQTKPQEQHSKASYTHRIPIIVSYTDECFLEFDSFVNRNCLYSLNTFDIV